MNSPQRRINAISRMDSFQGQKVQRLKRILVGRRRTLQIAEEEREQIRLRLSFLRVFTQPANVRLLSAQYRVR
jgi:hypothetical protein